MLKCGFKCVLMRKVTSQILLLWCVSGLLVLFFNNRSSVLGYKIYLKKHANTMPVLGLFSHSLLR